MKPIHLLNHTNKIKNQISGTASVSAIKKEHYEIYFLLLSVIEFNMAIINISLLDSNHR